MVWAGTNIGNKFGGFSNVIGKGSYNPTLNVWKQSIAALLAGTGDVRGLNIGDSTTFGADGFGVQTKPNEYTQAATSMGSYVPKSEENSFFGFSTGGGQNGSRFLADDRVANNGAVLSSIACLGGFAARLQTAGTSFTFTPTGTCDTFRVFWWYNGSVAVSIQATGGTAFATTLASGTGTQHGSSEYRYIDVTAASLTAGNTVTISKTGGAGNFEVVGIEAWNSAVRRLEFINCGHWGSRSAQWGATSGGGRLPSDFLAKVPSGYYHFATIKPPINDAGNSIAIPTFLANLQVLVNALKSKNIDIIMETGNPTSANLTPPYISAMKTFCIQNNIYLINTHDTVFIDYTNANAQGWMTAADGTHPNVLGYTQQKNALVSLLVAKGGL